MWHSATRWMKGNVGQCGKMEGVQAGQWHKSEECLCGAVRQD